MPQEKAEARKAVRAAQKQFEREPDAAHKARRKAFAQAQKTLTLDELVRELTVDSAEFQERDRVQRAVRDLIAGGLIHRVGDLVLPTRAAVNFHELGED